MSFLNSQEALPAILLSHLKKPRRHIGIGIFLLMLAVATVVGALRVVGLLLLTLALHGPYSFRWPSGMPTRNSSARSQTTGNPLLLSRQSYYVTVGVTVTRYDWTPDGPNSECTLKTRDAYFSACFGLGGYRNMDL